MSDKTEEFVRGLRELATFYEANPDLDVPVIRDIDVFTLSIEKMRKFARRLGKAEKKQHVGYIILRRKFGNINLDVHLSQRRVCRRVKVGEREIPARVEPIYEYECPDSLLQEPVDASD